MSERLVDTILIWEKAAIARHNRRQGPVPDVDETTEDDVRAVLYNEGLLPSEAVRLTPHLTRGLRIMLRGIVDQQG